MAEKEFKIEKNIEIPKTEMPGRWKELAAGMENGDSVGGLTKQEAASFSTALRKRGVDIKVVVRKEDGDTYRAWMSKKETVEL